MSETIKKNNEATSEGVNDNPYGVLSEMKDDFDPAQAEKAKQKALETKHVLDESNHLNAEYSKTDLGQQEQSIEETFDSWYNDIDEMVKSGQIGEDEAREMLDSMLESGIAGINAVRQEYVNQQELAGHEEVQRHLENAENNPPQEFSGETNINGKTGKERTFSEWDIHPKMGDETPREFGDREIKRNDMTVLTEYIPMLQDEDAKHYSQRVDKLHEDYPRAEGESLEDYRNRINKANEDNKLLISLANRTIDADDPVSKQLADDLNNIEDMQKSGRFDEDYKKQLQREVLEKAISDNWQNEQQKARDEKRAQTLEKLEFKKHEEVQRHLENAENNPPQEFSGETNINGKTGKERTFSEWDIHPRMENETPREYGDREIKRHDMTTLSEFIPKENDPNLTDAENVKAYSEKIEAFRNKFPRNEGESLDSYRNRIQKLADEGALTLEGAPAQSTQNEPPASPPAPTPAPKKRGLFSRITSIFGRNRHNKAA